MSFKNQSRTQKNKSLKPATPLILFALGTFTLISAVIPFPLISGTGYHDGQRIVEALFFLFALLVIALRILTIESYLKFFSSFKSGPPLCFIFLGLWAASTALSPRHGFYEWASLVGLLLISGAIAQEVSVNAALLIDKILLLCGTGCSLYILQALIAYGLAVINIEQAAPHSLIFGFDNYRFLNHIQTVGLPLLGLLLVRTEHLNAPKYFHFSFWLAIASLWWTLTFVSAGRGTFVAVWSGMLIAVLLYRRQAYPWFRAMALTCVLGLVTYFVLYVCVPIFIGLQPFGLLLGVVQRTAVDPSSSRLELWRLAVELVTAQPWLGIGPLHFAHHTQALGVSAHPHNFVLQIAAEWGLPALFAMLGVLYVSGKSLLRANPLDGLPSSVQNQSIFVVFVATAISIFLDSMVSGLMVMPSSQLWVTLYLGCAWGWVSSCAANNSVPTPPTSIAKRCCALAFVFSLQVLHLNGLWPEVLTLQDREKRFLELQSELHPVQFNPRVWRMGHF